MRDEYTWQPTQEQTIEANFGKEALDLAGGTASEILAAMKIALIKINGEEGPSDDKREKAKQYLEMCRRFADALYSNTTDVNTRRMPASERIEVAIKGATSLLTPGTLDQDRESAHQMITELNNRFSFPEFNK